MNAGSFIFRQLFCLNVQQISNLGEVDDLVIIDIDLYDGIKRILETYNIVFKVIDSHILLWGSTIQYSRIPIIFIVVCFWI